MDQYYTRTEHLIPAALSPFMLVAHVYRTHGATPSSPTLLFSHANGFTKGLWIPILRHMAAAGFQGSCVIFDMRHQGDSGVINADELVRTAYRFHWSDNVDDIVHLVKTMDLSPPLIGVGHSIGGCAVFQAQIDNPSLFQAIIGLDPIILPPGPFTSYFSKNLDQVVAMTEKKRMSWPSRDAIRKSFKKNPYYKSWDPEVLELFIQDAFHEDKANGSITFKCTRKNEADTFTGGNIHQETAARLGEISVPALFICGKTSSFLPMEVSIVNARKAPTGDILFVANTGHLVPFEAVGRTAEEILRVTNAAADAYGSPKARL